MIENTLGKLVEFPTVTEDRDANFEAVSYVGDHFERCGMFVERYDFNGYHALVATTRPGAKDSTVMVASHMDVVPAVSPAAFIPDVVGDKFYGRGALDMKFNIAAQMEIAEELYKAGTLSEYDIAFALTSDEEIGGTDGVARLLNQAGYRPAVCILPDGGDNWQIQTGSKGFLHYTIRASGETTHSRAPYEGDNAVLKTARAMLAVQGLFPEAMGPDTATNSPNVMIGGRAINQVPDTAEVSGDARFTSEEQKAHIRKEMGEICLAHDAELVVLVDGAATKFDLDNPYIAPFRRIVTEVTGIPVIGSKTLGSSDARFFAEYGIPVISLYPTGGGHHSEGEWIDVNALHQYKDVLRNYLDQMARVPLLTTEAATERGAQKA